MTGIERLRGFAQRMDELSVWPGGTKLLSIADQIERELDEELMSEHRAAQKYQSRCVALENAVRAAICAMERHVLGHEGMEDSPVARWARELRGAMGGCDDEEVTDVATVRADTMEAWRWVREHGGLSHVKDILHDFRTVVERIGVEWSESELHGLMDALDRRLMPEGMEWPRYEDGGPVRIGGEFMGKDGKTYTAKQIQFIGTCFSLYDFCDRKPQFNGFYGERVKRPAVLAADGNRIEPAMDVWWICEGDERGIHAEMLHVDGIDGDGMVECSPYNGGTSVVLDPAELYVKKPVLDADGVPIREDERVFGINGGLYRVTSAHDGKVFARYVDGPFGAEVESAGGEGLYRLRADQLTHTKPEPPDSWEQLKADIYKEIEMQPTLRTTKRGIELFVNNVVRRCRALAERGE